MQSTAAVGQEALQRAPVAAGAVPPCLFLCQIPEFYLNSFNFVTRSLSLGSKMSLYRLSSDHLWMCPLVPVSKGEQ